MGNSTDALSEQASVAAATKYEILNRKKQLVAEISHWSAVLARQPDMIEGYLALADALREMGEIEQADTCCQKAYQLQAVLNQKQIMLAHALLAERRYDEAFNVWTQVLEKNPTELEICRLPSQWFQEGRIDLTQQLLQIMVDKHLSIAKAHQLDRLQIRFLRGFASHIGHMGHLDWYVKKSLLGLRSPHRPMILAGQTPNLCYLNYWKRYIPDIIIDPVTTELMAPVSKYLEDWLSAVLDSNGNQKVDSFYNTEYAIQKQWDDEGRPDLLTLTDEDKERGWRCLRENFGVPQNARFVSIHVKDDPNWHHNQGTRDAQIETYLPAITAIVSRGGWVIRMGDNSMPRLPEMPQVIDYAHSSVKCDWMDVFLWAQCRFFVGTNSGPAFIPPTFGVPVVVTNWSPIGLPVLFSKGLYIFKLIWSECEQRHLTVSEILSNTLGFTNSPAEVAARGVHLVDNTPEEILEVVLEMFERLEGGVSYTDEENDLQVRFNQIKGKSPGLTRIGRKFLSRYSSLLC